MRIETGLFDSMVLQRNGKNVSDAPFSGTCAARGPVTASVLRGKGALKGFAGVRVGVASRGRMRGRLAGLPAGGPYDIELKAGAESLVVRNVLVGDVWLLGGQSNMQGCGWRTGRGIPADPLVRAFGMNDRWTVARDPIHNMWECVDQVHIDLSGGCRPPKPGVDWGVCPGPAFGSEMRRITGVPQGLVACAHGGTSMAQWDPGLRKEGGKSLYGALVRRLGKNGGRVAGMIWYQGCSDANADAARVYTERMKKLVSALRRDCNDANLPVVIVQISRVVGWGPDATAPWNSIQDQQRKLSLAVRNMATVPAVDLALDDPIHISGDSQYVLGRRLAGAMQVLRRGRRAGLPPIALKKAHIETIRGAGVVVAEFGNVAGRLCSGSRPSGFAVVTANGAANHFDIRLDGARALIRTALPADILAGAALHYGHGTDPYCNICDEAGRSLPVFGPVRLGTPRAITPCIRKLGVSVFQPSAGKLADLECPAGPGTPGMTPRVFGEDFCNLHNEIAQRGGRDEVVYFAGRFACSEPMSLSLVLGYDGPVKAWVDGALVHHDPNGTNPATLDKARVPFKAKAGEHGIVVALGTNHGAAWGIFLRLERLGVPKALLQKGPSSYAMPEWLG